MNLTMKSGERLTIEIHGVVPIFSIEFDGRMLIVKECTGTDDDHGNSEVLYAMDVTKEI